MGTVLGGGTVNFVTTVAPAIFLSDSFTEAVAIKMLTNMGTHITMDLLDVTNRLARNFRTTGTNLAA